MRFGLFMQPVHHPRENPTLALERDLDLIEHLDKLGYDEVWIGEHHSTGWETIASPDIFIATAAARTQHIRLGSGVVPLSLHHPLLIADNYVLLDHLTHGRAMLGVGAGGGLPSDPLVFGLDPATQPRRFLESFDALMQLLTTIEPLTLRTDWFALREAVLQLRPYTHPHLPIAIVTGRNPEALARIGRHGARWLTMLPHNLADFESAWAQVEAAAQEAGRTASRHDISATVIMHLAPTREEALDDIRHGAAAEHFDFAVAVNGRSAPDVPRDEWVDTLADGPTALIGTPDEAVHKLRKLREQTGIGGIIITSKEWAPRDKIWRSYELFARYVMPEFQGSLVGLRAAEAAAKRLVTNEIGQ